MKKIPLLISLILLFFLSSISNVKSSFEGGRCPPVFFGCSPGYECYDFPSNNLYTQGKKVGWSSYNFFGTDSGPHKYMVISRWDIILLTSYTVTSKVLFTGNYKLTPNYPTQVTELTSTLTYNNSYVAYVFNPSYGFIDYACSHYRDCGVYYPDCGILLLSFTQTDHVDVSASFQYKTFLLDFNEDGKVDVLDAIIFSNQYGKSWGKPGDSVDPTNMNWRADINSDGIVNTLDATLLRNQFGTNYIAPNLVGSSKWIPEW